ncbi:MAG: STAS domain-containing protein [Pseudomonadota bacterium]
MEFRISEGEGKRVYHLTGRFTHSDNDAFSPVIKDVGTGPGRTILLDLSGLDYLDSFGIGLFLVARDEARHSANRLEFGEPKGAVRKLFELAGLASLLSPDAPVAGQASARQIPGSFVHGASRRFTVSEPVTDDRGTCRLALGGGSPSPTTRASSTSSTRCRRRLPSGGRSISPNSNSWIRLPCPCC